VSPLSSNKIVSNEQNVGIVIHAVYYVKSQKVSNQRIGVDRQLPEGIR
jgi:hypothetical protein